MVIKKPTCVPLNFAFGNYLGELLASFLIKAFNFTLKWNPNKFFFALWKFPATSVCTL